MMISQHNQDIYKRVNSGKIIFRYKLCTYFELLLSRQKLGSFLENKVLQKVKFSKDVNILIVLGDHHDPPQPWTL